MINRIYKFVVPGGVYSVRSVSVEAAKAAAARNPVVKAFFGGLAGDWMPDVADPRYFRFCVECA